jgi:hypothetical protein
VIVFLRKLHWDAIQLNLFQLQDDIGGKVIRKGFLTRPLYHGTYNNLALTINFSTEKFKKNRRNYIDITIGKNFKNPLTISSLDWLRERDESVSEYEPIKIANNKYGLRREKNIRVIKKNHKTDFINYIKQLHPINFIYFSKNGLLFERECLNIANETEYVKLKDTINLLYKLIEVVE